MEKLKFQKMWEAADTFVFDIDTGSIMPIMDTLPKIASFADKHWFYHYENGIGAAYYEEGEMRKAAEFGFHDFSNTGFRKRYFSGIKSTLESGSDLYRKIEETDLAKISIKELEDLFQQSVDAIVDNFGYYLACQPQCVSLIEKTVQERLSEVLPEGKVIEAFTLLSTPTASTKMKREELDWLNLIVKSKKDNLSEKDISDLIRNHHSKYFLLNASDGHEPWGLNYFSDKFRIDKDLSLSDLEDRISILEESGKKIEDQKAAFIERYDIGSDVTEYCDLLAEIGHYRLEMRFVWMPGYYYDKLILNETAKRFSLDAELIRFATVAEIMNVFKGVPIDMGELRKRNDSFMFVIENGKTSVFGGNEAKRKLVEYVPSVDNGNIREFKGNIAMKGKVEAKALVYRWGDDMNEKLASVEGKFILVAGQTRPQLMPLIVKSRGIVTDEGGITSHAAIVSRELGIPCVIGTKIATEVIKDGDLVEVDADNGVVRIIERS